MILIKMYLLRFLALNAVILYAYFTNFQQIDEEEFGGAWELTKEGFVTSLAGFLVSYYNRYRSRQLEIFLSHCFNCLVRFQSDFVNSSSIVFTNYQKE